MEGFTAYKFRYILGADEKPRQKLYLATYLIGDATEYFATCGYETVDIMNKPTKPQLHMHFYIKWGKSLCAIRKSLQRHFKQIHETRKSHNLYSLTEVMDCKDINQFLRSPFMQGERLTLGFPERVPSNFVIENEINLAMEEQQRLWDSKLEKNIKPIPESTQELNIITDNELFYFLDEINEKTPFNDKNTILIQIITFYVSKNKTIDRSIIMKFLHSAVFRYKLESIEETANEWLNV